MMLKKIIRVDFSTHALPKSKIGLAHLDFKEFLCGERLIHSEKHLNKRCLFIEFEKKKIVGAVFEIFTSGLIFGLPYPTFDFQIFVKTGKYYLCSSLVHFIKFGVSIFISFGDIKR